MTRKMLTSSRTLLLLLAATGVALVPSAVSALDGNGTLRISTTNGWQAFEVISQGDNPPGDDFDHAMPGTFDGIGAYMVYEDTLRILSNHETGDASISEVNVDLASLQAAVANMIESGGLGGQSFVLSARQAYGRWSDDAGATWTPTDSTANTAFSRFCSGQSYEADTFGTDRGFVDQIYVTGEEVSDGALFALDLVNRDLYLLSGVVGSAPGGNGGIRLDAWENAALVDTGETNYVALLLSPDGGSQAMQLYIGEKGKDINGDPSTDFLARNGLAYGSFYYLGGDLPANGGTNDGGFQTATTDALAAAKMEDVDTSPDAPTRVVLANQLYGTYAIVFSLDFSDGFDPAASSFTITEIAPNGGGTGELDSADNIDWTRATTLNGVSYPDGLVFVNEDNSSGEIWWM